MDEIVLEMDTRSLLHVVVDDYKFPMTCVLVANPADNFMITQKHVVLSVRDCRPFVTS